MATFRTRGNGSEWTYFAAVEDGVHGDEKAQAAVAGAPTATEAKAKVAMLTFDETAGQRLNMQLELPDEAKAEEAAIKLPCSGLRIIGQWVQMMQTKLPLSRCYIAFMSTSICLRRVLT